MEALGGRGADIGIMAYVTAFVPQAFSRVPRHGTIQFHPSLLPLHRGPSSLNWPLILGRSRTGLSIFRPVAGPDEGPALLPKESAIRPGDPGGRPSFDRIFPPAAAAPPDAAAPAVPAQEPARPRAAYHP